MKIEERLHEAMHEYADAIEPEPGSWSRISARFDDPLPTARTRPSRPPFVLAGVALALVVVLITVLVVRDDGDDTQVVTGPVATMPGRILAITVDGTPVVIRSKDSQRVSGATAIAGIGEGTQIAVLPNGTAAYVVRGDGNRGCADHSILRFTLGDEIGARELRCRARHEPDDQCRRPVPRLPALLAGPGPSTRDRAARPLDRHCPRGRGERKGHARARTFFADRLEFAADSRHVEYQLFDGAVGGSGPHEIDIVAGQPAPGPAVGVVFSGPGWVGVRGSTGSTSSWAMRHAAYR